MAVECEGQQEPAQKWAFVRFTFTEHEVCFEGRDHERIVGYFTQRWSLFGPARCDLRFTVSKCRTDWHGKQVDCLCFSSEDAAAIYQVQAEHLRVCLVWDRNWSSGPPHGRPADFTTHSGDGRWLFTLERHRPATGEGIADAARPPDGR
jgi:hypothetical protein